LFQLLKIFHRCEPFSIPPPLVATNGDADFQFPAARIFEKEKRAR
jgi:hypothetical protein